jgi:catechol 2,3-dioxygenase-like lactoylglutathione lyase family enzyme
MASLRLEHVNITVADPDRTSDLLRKLFDWHVRWSGTGPNGGYYVHVGSTDHYVALFSRDKTARTTETFSKGRPLNHICIEVDDLDAVEARVISAGLKPFSHADYEPGRRFYFLDPDGIEFEIVSYT